MLWAIQGCKVLLNFSILLLKFSWNFGQNTEICLNFLTVVSTQKFWNLCEIWHKYWNYCNLLPKWVSTRRQPWLFTVNILEKTKHDGTVFSAFHSMAAYPPCSSHTDSSSPGTCSGGSTYRTPATNKYPTGAALHLTHLPLVSHICVSELAWHWFR